MNNIQEDDVRRAWVRGATALIGVAVVGLVRPDRGGWSAIVAAVRGDSAPPRLDAVVTVVAGTALWCLAVWVVVVLAAGGLASLPGLLGAAGRLVVRLCVPRVLRGIVLGGVAGGLLLGPALAANAAPVWPTSPAAAAATTPGPAWPTTTPPKADNPPPTTDAPAVPVTPSPSPAAPRSTPTAAGTVVAPGDTLWSIAADALRHGGATPTDTAIAAAWPRWYAANRAVIGDDPGLLHPGTALSAPPSTDGSTP